MSMGSFLGLSCFGRAANSRHAGASLLHFNVALTASILAACSATSATAGIVSVGGSVVLRDPPAMILLNQWESNNEIRGWFEREVTLSSPLVVGHVNSGLVTADSQLISGSLPSGTTIRSYMVRVDPVGVGPTILTGSLVFDVPILGVYVGSGIGDTDSLLGRPGIGYNTNSARGMEFDGPGGSAESFEISADRLRIDFIMDTQDATDEIRILTAIPSPSTAILAGLGCIFAGRRRR